MLMISIIRNNIYTVTGKQVTSVALHAFLKSKLSVPPVPLR